MQDIFSIGELFGQVQMQKVFADGKTFVDCTPLENLSVIQKQYEAQKDDPHFDLKEFVHKYFSLPKIYSSNYISIKGRPITEHIELLWNELTRQPEEAEGSLIPLPYPYIVPGGRFREIFYWDSYFTMLGLQISGRWDLIENMVENFSYLIDKFGYIPNGNRTYFLGRSQPPFYASMVKLLSDIKSEHVLIHYLPQLEKEYKFWMIGCDDLTDDNISNKRVTRMPDGSILNNYWDENDTPRPESYKEDVELAKNVIDKTKLYRNLRAACESGWDFSSRWFKNEKDLSTIHTTEIIPVDLNCLLFNLEQVIGEAYKISGNNLSYQRYKQAANNRKAALHKYCWNQDKDFYFDFDYVEEKQKCSITLAACFPLFFKIASAEQAEAIAKVLQQYLLYLGGLQTTDKFTLQQWDAPNGWAPLQWVTIKGLINYGYIELAKEVATRWVTINEKVYDNTGKLMEKYNVKATDLIAGGGEYKSQDGFGWTNGVYLALNDWLKK